MGSVDPKKVAETLRRNATYLRHQPARAKATRDMSGKLSFAEVLGDSGNANLQETALDVIQRAVPADGSRPFVSIVGGPRSKVENFVSRASEILRRIRL